MPLGVDVNIHFATLECVLSWASMQCLGGSISWSLKIRCGKPRAVGLYFFELESDGTSC